MIICELKDGNGKPIAGLLLQEKTFKTGSRGFYANAKVEFEGKRFQLQTQLVEIHSKPSAESDKSEGA